MTGTIQLQRTTSGDERFRQLVAQLDADLATRDGEDHPFYDQYNGIAEVKYAIVALKANLPVGCGAIKLFSPGIMEVKRMYTPPAHRSHGIASLILKGLEQWAKELGNEKCILETGKMQPEAIALYQKSGYSIIPNFGQYASVENSVCFEKLL